MSMKAVLISIGDEVVQGKTINTNVAYLSRHLMNLGYDVIAHHTVGDDYDNIFNLVSGLLKTEVRLIVTTGGLGPTHDDFTKQVIADALGLDMEYRQEAFNHFDNYFKNRNSITYESNMSQAYFPRGARLIPNRRGTALGAVLEQGDRTFVLLVGPPHEMNEMFEHHVLKHLASKQQTPIIIEEYYCMGGGESEFEDRLKPLLSKYPDMEINPYASRGIIRYQLKANTSESSKFVSMRQEFFELLGDHVVGSANKEVEEYVFDELFKRKLKISIAESCTGGMFASKLVNVSGASIVFDEGIITYSNASKTKNLGVPKKVMDEFGAVSEETVEAMAIGVKKKTSSDVAIAITGIAGPEGGTPLKPVGLVYFSIVIGEYVYIEKKMFSGSREDIRIRTTMYVFWRLLVELRKLKQ